MATSASAAVPEPVFTLQYLGKDISADIAAQLVALTYTDVLEGESDSLEITLDDAEQLWQGDWYPDHGDKMELHIGYKDAPLLPCGAFEVDTCELSGAPDTFSIKALGAGVQKAVRTRQAKAYNKTTLAALAGEIAAKNGLKVEGAIEPVAIERVTQANEHDLSFLRRVASEYGYVFSVRGERLCFYQRGELKKADAVITIDRRDVSGFSFRDTIKGVVAKAQVSYHDPKTKAKKSATADDDNTAGTARRGKDALKLNIRAENPDQAQRKANAALERENEEQTSSSLSLMGNILLLAGVNIIVTGFGRYDGKYTITKSTHRFGRSGGYGTDVEIRRVRQTAQGAK